MAESKYVIENNMMSEGTSTPGGEEDSGWLGLGNIFGGSSDSDINYASYQGVNPIKVNGAYADTRIQKGIDSGALSVGADGKLYNITQADTGVLGTGLSIGDVTSMAGLAFKGADALGFGSGADLRDKQIEGLDANIALAKQNIKSNKQNMANKQSFYSGFARDSNALSNNAVSNKVG